MFLNKSQIVSSNEDLVWNKNSMLIMSNETSSLRHDS